jgi:branched-chain amino acid transport system permease protein
MKLLSTKSAYGMSLAIVVLAVLPWCTGSYTVSLFNDIGIGSLVALGLVLLTGVGGTTSFGQAAFVGIAAYATAWLTTTQGLSPWFGLAFALGLTGLSALVIGMLTLRLGGHFLPISTIAWGLSIALLFGNMEALGRHSGLTGIPPLSVGGYRFEGVKPSYYFIWLIVSATSLFSYNLLRSRPGRAIRGLRGGSTLLASVGADAYRVRLSLFVLAAFFAGLAGWLYAHVNRFVSPAPFDVSASINYLLMAVAGGLGSLSGAVIGSALVLLIQSELKDVLPMLTQRAGQMEAIVFAALFILLLHFARGGLVGFIRKWYLRFYGSSSVCIDGATLAKINGAVDLPRREMPMRGSQLLFVKDSVKRFGGLTAVNNVSFSITTGEIVGLIGPNGAGKSTMFNLLTCTAPMTAGKVVFLGRDITDLGQSDVAKLGLARTFQHVKLRPQMTLLDNVALGVYSRTRVGMIRAGLRLDRGEELRTLKEAQRQLERIGLGDRSLELAGNLPLGTQRVLEIARALAADPFLLVLDEPAAGLRRGEKLALGDLLRRLRSDGVTILIVEHDMDFVMSLVDRLVVMNFGSKLIEGAPEEIRADERVQAAYLGSVV